MNMSVPAWAGKVEELDATEFNRLARSTTDPLLLYIGAPWCPPCKTMGPALDAAAAAMGDQVRFLKVNGDANGMTEILHEAADDGRIAGDNAGRHPIVRPRPRRAPLGIVFSDPQIAMVGATFQQLKAGGPAFEVGEASFADQGRSRVMLENRGMIRVYADTATGIFLGAEMVGPAAEHIGHLLSWSVQRRDTVQQMIDSPFYHPVIEEGVRTALRHLQRKLVLPPQAPESCLDCVPGS